VEAAIEELTETDIKVTFDEVDIGWWTIEIAKSHFPSVIPGVGFRILIDVKYSAEDGIINVSVPLNTEIKPPLPKLETPARNNLPSEPENFDDPVQLENYTKELRRFFHLAK